MLPVVKFLLEKGGDVNAVGDDKDSLIATEIMRLRRKSPEV